MQTFVSTLGVKAQVTLPKNVRNILNVKQGDQIGFLIDGSRVSVYRAEIGPTHDPFTREEWIKITATFMAKDGKTYNSHKKSKAHLKRLMLKS